MNDLDQALKMSQGLLADSLLVGLAFSAGFAVICGWIAAHRKTRVGYWAAMGFIFGPFALPFVLRSKTTERKEEQNP